MAATAVLAKRPLAHEPISIRQCLLTRRHEHVKLSGSNDSSCGSRRHGHIALLNPVRRHAAKNVKVPASKMWGQPPKPALSEVEGAVHRAQLDSLCPHSSPRL